ncbi:MAG: hypothetical protein EOM21_19640 [Gammaproteobacteria bacterium]|nr:hypothetical protein [Gammaproteobacteria bacterium]
MLGVGIGVGLQHRSGAETSEPTGYERFLVRKADDSGWEPFLVRKPDDSGWEEFQVRTDG